jgi:lysophospholipase L1-like esterase
MTRLLLAVLTMASACTLVRAQDDPCQVPDYLTHVEGRLTRTPVAVRKEQKLSVLVVGTGSSALVGTQGALTSYPARLQVALSGLLPQSAVRVSADVSVRRTAAEMVVTLNKTTLDAKPDLVIWQTGTVDAMRGVDPDRFRETLEKGVAAVRAGGADVILVNMQYSPRTETMIAAQAYADAMHSVAQQQDVPLFDRLAAMKHWGETGVFDLSSRDRPVIAEKVHDCLGKVLAQLIVESAQLDRKHAKDTN